MESDLGKLFIGGISWDTDEERLREYFSKYGELVEAVIMRDRTTGRARGFGFIVFSDPSVAERVIIDKHMIDGRLVEAKKAVPRDDQHTLKRNPSPIHSSPGPSGRTKKIFVGGLPSNVTENEFKNYFVQFGMITDIVVMYDHNTLRPRGFGFVTFDSEEAVDRVLHKTFHELNGKLVEVKRAIPKQVSPGSNLSPLNYGMNRAASFFNNFAPGYSMGSNSGVGRFSPIGSGRTGFSGFGDSGYGVGLIAKPGLSPAYAGTSTFENTLGYNGRALNNPNYNGNSRNRYAIPIGYNIGRSDSGYNSTKREIWGNGGTTFGVSAGNDGENWGLSSGFGLVGVGYGRNGGTDARGAVTSFSRSYGYEGGSVGQLDRGGSVYGDSMWQPSSANELDGSSGSFGFDHNRRFRRS